MFPCVYLKDIVAILRVLREIMCMSYPSFQTYDTHIHRVYVREHYLFVLFVLLYNGYLIV